MLRFLLGLVAFLAIGASAQAQTREVLQGDCERGNNVVTTDGRNSTTKVQRSFPSCTVTVYDAGTVTLATIILMRGVLQRRIPLQQIRTVIGPFGEMLGDLMSA